MEKDYKDDRGKAMSHTKEHWEMGVSNSIFPKAKEANRFDDFIAKSPTKWPRTHVKVNDTDY